MAKSRRTNKTQKKAPAKEVSKREEILGTSDIKSFEFSFETYHETFKLLEDKLVQALYILGREKYSGRRDRYKVNDEMRGMVQSSRYSILWPDGYADCVERIDFSYPSRILRVTLIRRKTERREDLEKDARSIYERFVVLANSNPQSQNRQN